MVYATYIGLIMFSIYFSCLVLLSYILRCFILLYMCLFFKLILGVYFIIYCSQCGGVVKKNIYIYIYIYTPAERGKAEGKDVQREAIAPHPSLATSLERAESF